MIDDCVQPTSYARQLATYIKCPSTIRARTFDQFGYGPSLERCRRYRAEVEHRELRELRHMEHRNWGAAKDFACGHPRTLENTVERDGRDKCRTCRSGIERTTSQRHRDKDVKAIERLTFAPYVEPEAAGYLFAGDLLRLAAKLFNTTAADLRGKSRYREHVIPRAVLINVLRNERAMSYPQIGTLLNRDHSTVIHAVKKLPSYIQESELVGEGVAALTEAARRTT